MVISIEMDFPLSGRLWLGQKPGWENITRNKTHTGGDGGGVEGAKMKSEEWPGNNETKKKLTAENI